MNNYNVNQNGNLTKPAEVDWLKKAEYASAAAMQGRNFLRYKQGSACC